MMEYSPSPQWTSVNIDYTAETVVQDVKRLDDMCAGVIISDVYILERIFKRLPNMLYSYVLHTALTNNRVLSSRFLMLNNPSDTFSLPLPENLRTWTVLHKDSMELAEELQRFKNNAEITVAAFFQMIENNSLKMSAVDLGELPLCNRFVHAVQFFLDTTIAGVPITHDYTLRMALTLENNNDVQVLYEILSRNPQKVLHLIVTGLQFFNGSLTEKSFLRLMEVLEHKELLFFSVEYCTPRFKHIFPKVLNFENLMGLNLTHIKQDPEMLETLKEALNRLKHLRRLSLRGCKLSGLLEHLFLSGCDGSGTVPDCCFMHRGKLEHLDISFCRLKDQDLDVLQSSVFCRRLKFLDIGHNYFHSLRFQSVIQSMASNVVVLNIQECVMDEKLLKAIMETLRNMLELKSLNMCSPALWKEHFPELFVALYSTSKLRYVSLNRPENVDEELCDDFEFSLKMRKHINVIWC